VLGNHDLYRSSGHTTIKRMTELWNYEDSDDVLHILNGNVIEYKGVRFGGAAGWYDATFLKHFDVDYSPLGLWKNSMNDHHYIEGLGDFYDLYETEREKLEDVHKKCDVMISHVNPSNKLEHISDYYKYEPSSAFYSFAGEDLLLNTTASYWFYGHSHGQFSYNEHGVECIMNTRGYPMEAATRLTMELEV